MVERERAVFSKAGTILPLCTTTEKSSKRNCRMALFPNLGKREDDDGDDDDNDDDEDEKEHDRQLNLCRQLPLFSRQDFHVLMMSNQYT